MKQLLSQLAAGGSLSLEQAVQAFELIVSGQATPAQLGALLGMIQVRGATVDEITGGAQVLRARATPVTPPPGLRVIDTCGTGGDGAGTFNISTAAALVAAGAGRSEGVAVAKHGNRSVTSQSGSSQVVEELGVRLESPPEVLSRCLDEAGICFCFAPAHHPATRHATTVRQDLGFRTIFNLLGPLTNPAGADRQLMGVYSRKLTEPIAHVLKALGAKHAMVVCALIPAIETLPLLEPGAVPAPAPGAGRLDELSTVGRTRVSELLDGRVRSYELEATTLGLPLGDMTALRVPDPRASAAVIRQVLAGMPGPARDIVCLNAAAALYVADVAPNLSAGLKLAAQSIDSGAAARALEKLVEVSTTAR